MNEQINLFSDETPEMAVNDNTISSPGKVTLSSPYADRMSLQAAIFHKRSHEYFEGKIREKEYNNFWGGLLVVSQTPISTQHLINYLEFAFKSDPQFSKLSNGDFLAKSFYTGMAYFLQAQNKLSSHEINLFLSQTSHKFNFYNSLEVCEQNVLDVLSQYKNKIPDNSVYSLLDNLVKKNNLPAIKSLCRYAEKGVLENAYSIKRLVHQNYYDLELIDILVEKHNVNINAIGVSSRTRHNDASLSLANLLFLINHQQSEEKLIAFMEKYGHQVNLDTVFCLTNDHQNFFRHKPFINSVLESSTLGTQTKLNRLSLLLDNSELSVKHLGQITQILFQDKVLNDGYDHPFIQKLFSHPTFNSSHFDRKPILHLILTMDNSDLFNSIRQTNNHTVNPTTYLLDLFYQHSSIDHYEIANSPFFVWAKQQKKTINENTLKYLLNKYEKDVLSFTSEQFEHIKEPLVDLLKNHGFKVPKKKGFLDKIFGSKDESPILIKESIVESVPEEPMPVLVNHMENIYFNKTLFSQVNDVSIQKYLSSIELNVEQFILLVGEQSSTEHHHYMTTLLPRLLNSSIENYLHFATMDEEEAKENITTQLQLLNKRTFEVLNQSLQNEKDNSARHSRAVGRMIKNN